MKLADAFLLKRLMFDTPKERQSNKLFYCYNPHLTADRHLKKVRQEDEAAAMDVDEEEDDSWENSLGYLKALYGAPPQAVPQDAKSSSAPARGVSLIKKQLETLVPYVTFLNRIHNDVMEHPTTTHQMFQKSVFYEVLFFYCLYHTNKDTLNALILGCNDTYLGFAMASLERMRKKYTGKQYIAIIPRGLGKTRCIKLTIAVALVTFRKCELLAMAHTRSMVCTTKDDVETTLMSRFPPAVYGYETRHHEDCLIIEFPDGSYNRLKYASACRSASVRGNDPDIGFLDESLCVAEESYAAINPMIQRKHTKIGFVSSPISNKKDVLLNLVVNMEVMCQQINMYRLCYFCMHPLHVQHSTGHTGCYRKIFAPRYITYDEDNKRFEGVITRTEASYENEQGVIRPEDRANGQAGVLNPDDKPAFTKSFIRHLCTPTTHVRIEDLQIASRDIYYWIYIDPAYHSAKRSAIAIACVRFVKDTAVLCYMDRKLLTSGDIGNVSNLIQEMYSNCVVTLIRKAPADVKCNFFVAIENNSNPDSVRSYYNTWVDQRRRGGGRRVANDSNSEFFAFVKVYEGRNICYGYTLCDKFLIFDSVIHFLNSTHKNLFRVATAAEYGVNTKDICSLELLLKEIQTFHNKGGKFTGKISVGFTDDVVTCLIMALHMGRSYKGIAHSIVDNLRTERMTNCVPPWINIHCSCPLTAKPVYSKSTALMM
ncbi:hypothetical protein RRG08_010282 [Elysia crispata]|uniref:Probable DNA packing protein N-terminal domain-containing protein n=1 Tax=Elysia crispata TaxID=231223 RepID=A0AAE0Z299_9GAST|nr:hypothetical protein RRG08_010282 [Elysia crispata]